MSKISQGEKYRIWANDERRVFNIDKLHCNNYMLAIPYKEIVEYLEKRAEEEFGKIKERLTYDSDGWDVIDMDVEAARILYERGVANGMISPDKDK